MTYYNWITDESFGDILPETWEEDVDRINAALEAAGVPEFGELTPEQQDARWKIWEAYCAGEL